MSPLTLTFDIPAHIIEGLTNGSLVRNGGVIQNLSGQVVMWLKELNDARADSSFYPEQKVLFLEGSRRSGDAHYRFF